MTNTDVAGLVVLTALFVPALIVWQWQQVALNDVQDRKDAGRDQLLGWSYRRWRGRLTWSVVAIIRYHRAMQGQLGSSSGPHLARHAAAGEQARPTARRRTWWWLLSLPPWSLVGLILASVAGLPVPRLAVVAAAFVVVGLLVALMVFLAKLRLAARDQDHSES